MKIKAKGGGIEKYIQEELLSLLPRYRNGAGETVIYTAAGRHPDPRGVPWLVQRLASYYSVNLPELRRRCGELLGLRHHISLPLSDGLVLLPVKMRHAALPGETTTGFINLQQVQEILPPPLQPSPGQPPMPGKSAPGRPCPLQKHPGQPSVGQPSSPAGKESTAWLSRIQFRCGLQLKTLNTPETLRERLRQGKIVYRDFLQRRSQGTAFTGLSRQALLKQLPNCDCILKDFFIVFFSLKPDGKAYQRKEQL